MPALAGLGNMSHVLAVEGRTSSELLLVVKDAPFRTWLKTEPTAAGRCRLLFGSAVLPQAGSTGGPPRPHWLFRLTERFHIAYAKSLLRAAAADWRRGKRQP
ncbi:hypothetical protein [Bauldia sp.]|uniref:hypothetical protein n=1 Tax=Bauldia sp. TaxID=2575872 RepID=UPI003BACAF5D